MTKISYSGYRFPPEIIQHAIWFYYRFTLSFRDVEDLLAEREIVNKHRSVNPPTPIGSITYRVDRLRDPAPINTSDLSDDLPRDMKLPADLLDRPFLNKIRPAKLCDRLHNQHSSLGLPTPGGQCGPSAPGFRLDANHTRSGSIFHANSQRRNKQTALKLMRKLLKKYGFVPDKLVTDDLKSYRAAASHLGIAMRQERGRWRNNRMENSHQPTRRRERKMQGFKSAGSAQGLLPVHAAVYNTFNVQRDLVSARTHRAFRTSAMQTWRKVVAAE